MSISRISTNLSINEKIRQLNEMILELNGKIDSGKFDKNELDSIYSDSAFDRKYLRNVALGNTTGTYSNWTHVKAETGYSIWKISPTNYQYDSTNNLYFDGASLNNKGSANSETATSFDKVYVLTGSMYTDNTTESATETGTEFTLLEDTTDYLYVGSDATFSGIKFEFETRGSNNTLVIEYYNGSSWTALSANTDNLLDDTSNFESDGLISYTTPDTWTTTTINSINKYWIRISTSTTPVTVAKAYYIIPGDSVVGLLALSSDEIINGDWAWCSYSGAVYVTIRNSGSTTYEGDYYITSSSSTNNLKNFFIYNHEYTADYYDSTYVSKNPSLAILSFSSSSGITVAGSTTTYGLLFPSDSTTFSTTEANRQSILPVNCQIKNFYVRTTTSQPSGGALTFTIRKNGVDTAVVITISASGAAQTASYTGSAVSFSAGDLISLKIANASGSTSATIRQIALEVNKT